MSDTSIDAIKVAMKINRLQNDGKLTKGLTELLFDADLIYAWATDGGYNPDPPQAEQSNNNVVQINGNHGPLSA